MKVELSVEDVQIIIQVLGKITVPVEAAPQLIELRTRLAKAAQNDIPIPGPGSGKHGKGGRTGEDPKADTRSHT